MKKFEELICNWYKKRFAIKNEQSLVEIYYQSWQRKIGQMRIPLELVSVLLKWSEVKWSRSAVSDTLWPQGL